MGPEQTLRVERKPAPIRTQVLDNLRKAILTRQLAPGQRLIERELVEMTGVSRTSVREALRAVVAEGLVSTAPNKGTAVATLSSEQARQIYEVRAVLEGLAGRLFVENATEVQAGGPSWRAAKIDRLASRGVGVLEAKDLLLRDLVRRSGQRRPPRRDGQLAGAWTYLRSLSLSREGRPAKAWPSCTTSRPRSRRVMRWPHSSPAAVTSTRLGSPGSSPWSSCRRIKQSSGDGMPVAAAAYK